MKNRLIVKLKNIFMYITLIWSSVMLLEFLNALLVELPFLHWINYVPLGEFIFGIWIYFLLFGICGIPVLYIITIILMTVVYVKFKDEKQNKLLSVSVVILPAILIVLMLLIGFTDILS